MWGRNSRLDRIEKNIETLVEISVATNRRIDRFVEASEQQLQAIQQQLQAMETRTEQLQRAVEYLLSQDS